MNEPGILVMIRSLALQGGSVVVVDTLEARELIEHVDSICASLALEMGCQCEPWKRTGGVHASTCGLYEEGRDNEW